MFEDGPERLILFRVGGEQFALPMSDVDEVIDAPVIQHLPDAGPATLGIAGVRGVFVTVYDARPILCVDGGTMGAALLFVRDDRRVGLAIDDVFDPLTVGQEELRPVPGASDGIVIGLVRRGSQLVAVLDTQALLDAAAGAGRAGATQGGRT